MKSFGLVFLLFAALLMNAQVYNTPKFLGIPIDGSKSEMISKLQQIGYTLCKEPELARLETLEGVFNGNNVHIAIVANKDIVYRIVVRNAFPIKESDIKTEYNTLVKQFRNNKKYFYDTNDVQFLEDSFDIAYEMGVKKNRVYAHFTQRLTEDEIVSLLERYPEIKQYDSEFQKRVYEQAASESNAVWFMINRLEDYYDYYSIVLYYDNLNNEPNGEDL